MSVSPHRAAQKRASYLRHRDSNLARSQRWAEANRERVREIARAFYARHRVEESQRQRERRSDPDYRLRKCAREQKRNALKRDTQIGAVDYSAVIEAANGVCGICGEPIGTAPRHIDHIVPLAAGGSHTQTNLQLAHAICNVRKGARAA